jgi:hypothetical protein
VRPTACYQKQHDDNTFVHWRSHTPSILRLLHRCRGRGHRLPRNHLLLGMFLLHQAAEDGLPHVRTPMLKPPMLPTPNLLELRRLGMPALKPPEACSPMLHPMLLIPGLRGHAGVDTACSLPSLALSAHFRSHHDHVHVCPHSTQSLHSRFLTREHYLWAWLRVHVH